MYGNDVKDIFEKPEGENIYAVLVGMTTEAVIPNLCLMSLSGCWKPPAVLFMQD